MYVSVLLVALYCILMMGGCSPIHFRSGAAAIAIFCVILSYLASSGLAFYMGLKITGVHNLLPFLLIGIGVDDMFIIAYSIDQTEPTLPCNERIRVALTHSGTSITITSITNSVAFFLGAFTQLEALRSFCIFAGLGVLFLYAASLTIFTAFMVWDIKRQVKRKGDCKGACKCKENSILCCRGYFLTPKQKRYPFTDLKLDG